jgi:hypothetical protein
MKNILMIFLLLAVMSGKALAGSGYDTCIKEEKALKVKETAECNGLRYLLNPSACYGTQKSLNEYKAGKCRQIGINENVDFSTQPVVPSKKISAAGNIPTASAEGNLNSISKDERVRTVSAQKAGPEIPKQEPTAEQLKEENTRLKAEISRLNAELEQFGKACR